MASFINFRILFDKIISCKRSIFTIVKHDINKIVVDLASYVFFHAIRVIVEELFTIQLEQVFRFNKAPVLLLFVYGAEYEEADSAIS